MWTGGEASGDHAVFNCTAIATDITWRINGDYFNADFIIKGFEEQPLIVLNVLQNLRLRQLRVLGSPDSDNASIICVTILQLSQKIIGNTSTPVLLLVQGITDFIMNRQIEVQIQKKYYINYACLCRFVRISHQHHIKIHQLHYCPHLLESSLHSGGGTHPGLQCHHHQHHQWRE